MTKLKYKKLYKSGGGGFETSFEGVEIVIHRNYEQGNWYAQSYEPINGEYIDIEAERLDTLKWLVERELGLAE